MINMRVEKASDFPNVHRDIINMKSFHHKELQKYRNWCITMTKKKRFVLSAASFEEHLKHHEINLTLTHFRLVDTYYPERNDNYW